MSIYDRDYFKQQDNPNFGRSPFNKGIRLNIGMTPVVKKLLIINIAVFIVMTIGEAMKLPFFSHFVVNKYGQVIGLAPSKFDEVFGLYNPYFFKKYFFWQLLTYQFLHGSFWHIFVNMFTLYMIGKAVERQIGSKAFLRLYLLGGIFAGLINLLSNMLADVPTVGASGSICAIVAAFGLMNPNTPLTVLILFFPITMRAKTMVIGFAVITALFAIIGRGNIAHLAHLGGLVFGWMYVYNIWGVHKLINSGGEYVSRGSAPFDWKNWLKNLKRKFGKKPKLYKGEKFEDATYTNVNFEKDESEINRVLDKMSKKGVHSLTDEEWKILDKYKRGK